MNITNAFELLRHHLPQEVADKAAAQLTGSPSVSEMTIEGFSLWKVKDAKNLAFIVERRSAACPEHNLRLALEKQHKLLTGALRDGTQDQLWQAYFASGGKHTSFVLNLATSAAVVS